MRLTPLLALNLYFSPYWLNDFLIRIADTALCVFIPAMHHVNVLDQSYAAAQEADDAMHGIVATGMSSLAPCCRCGPNDACDLHWQHMQRLFAV